MAPRPYPHPDRHDERRRRAHIAEILATPDWVRSGSGQTATSNPDNCVAERKATREKGVAMLRGRTTASGP